MELALKAHIQQHANFTVYWKCEVTRNKGTPSEASIPCLTGQPKAVRLGDLICSMRVSQGTSWRIEEDFARLCQRAVPFKCLLICWAPEREAPDSKDLSI